MTELEIMQRAKMYMEIRVFREYSDGKSHDWLYI